MLFRRVLTILAVLIVVALLVTAFAFVFSLNTENWCEDLSTGDCAVYVQGERNSICYCIDKITSTQNDYYQASQSSCDKFGGHLATATNDELLKWLAKKLYLKGVDDGLIGLRKLDTLWHWMHPEGPQEATGLVWRENVEQNLDLTHASIDVRSIIVQNDDFYNGYRSYNYDFYKDYSRTDVQWFGLVTTNATFGQHGGRYYICQYTRHLLLLDNNSITYHLDKKLQKPQDDLVEKEFTKIQTTKEPPVATTVKQDTTCQCNEFEAIDLSKTGDSRIINSPGYPKGYCNNQNCGWVVKVPEGLAVRLQWMAFNTENKMDFVFVYDSSSKDYTKLLATCTGNSCPNHVSSGDSMYIHFTSDHVTKDIGFKALVTAVQTDACYCSESEEIILGSVDESFSFTSPNFLNGHCENQNCKWVIKGPNGYGLHVSWDQFNMGMGNAVTLRDGAAVKDCDGVSCDELITDSAQLEILFTSGNNQNGTIGISALVKIVQNYCDKNDLDVLAESALSYTKEKQDGFIAVGGTAMMTCPEDHKIIDTRDKTTDFVICASPHWSRQLYQCIPICHLDIVAITADAQVMNLCNFQDIQHTSQIPLEQSFVVEQHNMTSKEHLSSVEYSCTDVGWTPAHLTCAKMTQAILLLSVEYRISYANYSMLSTIYIPNQNSTQLSLDLPDVRFHTVSALMINGKVLVAGGITWNPGDEYNERYNEHYLSSSYTIDLNLAHISMAPDMGSQRSHASATELNGLLYVCAGYTHTHNAVPETCHIYDGHNWTVLTARLNVERRYTQLVAVNDTLYLLGGYDMTAGHVTNMVERYSTDTGEWQLVEFMQDRRSKFGATVVDGIIFVCGGVSNLQENRDTQLSSCEQYVDCAECDTVRKKVWRRIANMNEERYDFAMVALGQTLYALGGKRNTEVKVEMWWGNYMYDEQLVLQTVESYHPAEDQWRFEDLELPSALEEPTAVAVPVLEGLDKL